MKYRRWDAIEGGRQLPTAREAAAALSGGSPTDSEYNVTQRRWNGSRPVPLEVFLKLVDAEEIDDAQAMRWMRELVSRRESRA
jgi:hypothetical protein